MGQHNKGIFRQFYLNGVIPDMSPLERRGIIFNNINIFFYFLTFIVGALFHYYLHGADSLFWWLTIIGFTFVPIYVLNGAGYFTLSSLGFVSLGSIGVFIAASALGRDSNVHYFYIIIAYSLFLNSLYSRKLLIFQLLLVFSFLLALFVFDFDIGYHIEVTSSDLSAKKLFIFVSNFVLVALLSFNFRSYHDDILEKVERYFKEREEFKGVSESQHISIAEKQQLLQAIYDNSNAGIILEDPEKSTVLDVNGKAEKIFRRFKSDLVGSNPMSLLTELKAEQMSEILHSVREKVKWSGETIIRDNREKVKWINLSLLHFESAGREYRLWSIQDVNSIKNSQAELELRNKELKDLNENLDAFVYSVAHDMRGPLATLQSLIELNGAAQGDEESLRMQKELIFRMERYIEDVVNFSKNKRVEIEKTDVNLAQLIQLIRQDLSHYKQAQKIDLFLDGVEGVVIKTDEYRIKIILQNLIANAVNYADLEKEQPSIRLKCEEDSEGYLITVSDNGIGIDEEYHEKVFKMFFRGSAKSTGSGLGLFLVKESAKKLGGKIELSSTKGEGTEFKLRLPK